AKLEINEGCLSVPDMRATVIRHAEVDVEFTNRSGEFRRTTIRGLTAGTFQHEIDHLNGTLFLDRVRDTRTLTTWEMFERYGRADFEEQAREIVERYGS